MIHRRHALILVGRCLVLLAALALTAAQISRAPAQAGPIDPQTAWQRAREAGSYRFAADITQRTIPLPILTNAGREVKEDAIRIEGQTDLATRRMDMRLWSQGGSVLDPDTALEIEIDGDRARARQGGAWQDIENVVDWAAPEGDFLAFLAAAKNVTLTPAPLSFPGRGAGGEGRSFTRYLFDLDGPRYAAYMRDLLQERLVAEGELPAGVALDLPRAYTQMAGHGELWIGADGLPLRQILQLQFPAQDDHRVEADITIDFVGFGFAGGAASSGVAAQPANAMLPQSLSRLAGITLIISLSLALILNARSRKVRVAISLALVFSLVVPPAITSAQVEAFHIRQAERQESLEAMQAGSDMQRALNTLQAASTTSTANAETLSLIRSDGGQDSDRDGRSDVQEMLMGTNPQLWDAASSPAAPQVETGVDSDGDGLTDFEESLLGTDPTSADTDDDLIGDALEINGFTYAGRLWSTDPLKVDTNGDGIGDTQEWRFADSNWDLDGDNTPDLFDYDNDGDGVPDRLDLSPFTRVTNTFTPSDPFQLSVTNLITKPTYLEFQVRPTNPDYLWYAFNVLDWPHDTEGQMRDDDGKTFFDVCLETHPASQCVMTPDDNGDLKIVPMLEIEVARSAWNLRSLFEDINAYGISRRFSADFQTVTLLVPLQLVADERTGQNVAFTGKYYFRGVGSSAPHKVRLAWVLQGLVDDTCLNAGCTQKRDNVAQPIHTYYTDWQLTGLDVREDHGANIGLIYEDPLEDTNLNKDDVLQSLAYGLDQSFLAGTSFSHPDNPRPFRAMQIFHIHSRFHHPNGGENEFDARRWDLPNILRVDTYRYDHLDQALAATVMTTTKQALNTHFTPVWSAANPITPTILMAREEFFRTTNLDDPNGALSWSGNSLTLDVNGVGGNEVTTLASLKWTPYQYDGSTWQAMPIDAYWDEFERRHAPTITNSDPDEASGKLLVAQLYYLALYSGVESVVEQGNIVLTHAWGGEDFEIAGNVATSLGYGLDAMLELWEAGIPQTMWKALGQLRTLGAQASLASVKSTLKGGELYRLMKTAAFKTAIFVAVVLLVAIAVVVLSAVLPEDVTGSLGFKIATASFFGLIIVATMIIRPIVEAVRAVRAAVTATTAASRAQALQRLAQPMSKAAKVVAVVGLIIDLGITWGFFFAAWGKGDIKPGTIAFNHAVTLAIVQTVLAVVLFALGFIPVVGPILVALIVIIDLILGIFGTSIAEVIADLIHAGGPLVEMRSDEDIENPSYRPPRDLVVISDTDIEQVGGPTGIVGGVGLRFVARVTTNAFQPVPKASDISLSSQSLADKVWSETSLRKGAFAYALTTSSAPVLSVPALNSRAGSWQNVGTWFIVSAIGGGTAYLRRGQLVDALASPVVTLTQGLNQPLSLYFQMAYNVPGYECWGFIAYNCKIAPDTQSYSGSADPSPLNLTLDVFPPTFDEFYALTWDLAFEAQADRDGDGLIVADPIFDGIDPDDTTWDSDGDGLSDRYEVELQRLGVNLSPTDADSDNDGLTDYAEVIAGDTFGVNETIRLGSNPAAADTDGDGLSDKEEIEGWIFEYATGKTTRVTSDPTVRDTDGDGLSDKGERDLHLSDPAQYRFHPRVPNAEAFVGFDYAFGLTYNGLPFIGPAPVAYTTTLLNLLTPDYVAQGVFSVTLPSQVQLTSGTPARTFSIPGGQPQVESFLLQPAPGATSGARRLINTATFAFDTNPLTTTQPVSAVLPSVADAVTVTVDADRPTAGPSSVFGYIRPGFSGIIHGRASDPTSGVRQVEISDDGASWQVVSGTLRWQALWSAQTSEGAHTLYARATDSVGNVENPPLAYTYRIDGTPPNVTHNLTPNAVISLTRNISGEYYLPLFGTSLDPNLPGALPGSGQERMFVEVTPNGRGRQLVWPNAFDQWAITYTLTLTDADGVTLGGDPSGAYTVTIESRDIAGNAGLTAIPIRVDNREPFHTLTSQLPVTALITQPIALSGRITETGPVIAGVANMEAIYFPADVGYSPGRWRAQYFDNDSLRRPPADSAIVDDVNFNWGSGSPTPELNPDSFSALFERDTTFRVSGTYRFIATRDADALVTASIDGIPVLSGGALSNTIHVDAGVHTLRVAYREGAGDASVAFGLELVDPDWLPFAVDSAGAGVANSTWTYTVPTGLEGFYRLGMRGVDQIGNRQLQPFAWEVWRGEIDTAPPRAALEVYFTGFGSTEQTHYVVSIEDFNLIEDGMVLPCGDSTVERFYYPTDWWRAFFDDETRLFQVTARCTRPGFVAEPPVVSACDAHGHCAALRPALPANPNYRTVYWSDMSGGTGRIARISLENLAAGVQPLVSNAGVTSTPGLAVDVESGYVYWTDRNAGLIRRANITDGLSITTILSGRSQPMGLALDNMGRMYWTEFTGGSNSLGSIMRADITGTNVITLNDFNVGNPTGIAVDMDAGKVYWANTTNPQYFFNRSDLDGTNWEGPIVFPDCEPGPVSPPVPGGIAVDGASSRLYWLDTFCRITALGSDIGLYRGLTVSPGTVEYLLFTDPITITNGLALDEPGEKMYWTTSNAVMRAALNGTLSETVVGGLTGAAGVALDFNYAPVVTNTIVPIFQNTPGPITLQAYDPEGDALAYTISVSPLNGSLSGSAPNLTYTPALNFTGGDVMTFTVADGRGGLTAGRVDVDVMPVTGVDSTVLTPTHGTLITSSAPISVSGGAFAPASLRALTVTVDGAPIYTPTWGVGVLTDTLWTTNWTPIEGRHTLSSIVESHAAEVQTDTHPIDVWVDLSGPTIAITPTVLTTTHLLPQPNIVALGGTASDATGLHSVQASVDGGAWQTAAISGSTWTLPWQAPSALDNNVVSVTALATDLAGRTQQITEPVTIDIAPPAPVTMTLAYTSSPGARVPISNWVVITDTPIQLVVEWTPSSDGAGLAGYWAGWTLTETLDAASLTALGVSATEFAQTPGEAQVLYAHLLIRDVNGNETAQTLGPVIVDAPATPDLIGDLDYRGWQASGGSRIGASRVISHTGLLGAQQLFASWDATALRFTWSGGNWDGDGDLFIYLDTTSGGATTAYNPYTVTLPTLDLGAVAADYLLHVEDSSTARLMQWNGSAWAVAQTLTSANFQHAPPHTDLLVPFAWLGIVDPAATSLRMAAFATEENRLDLWAAMPNHNPLNSTLVAQPLTTTLAFSLTRHYEWPSLGPSIQPNAGQFVDEDLLVSITPEPAGVAAGFLSDSLLDVLPPGTPLDADLDGAIDAPLLAREGLIPLGAGRVVTYTVSFENRGSEIAGGVVLTATARGALTFDTGTTKVVTLPNVGAGVSNTLAFTATAGSPGISGEVDVVVAEPTHGPFEWWAIQHDVDTTPPISVTVLAPITTTRLVSDTALGTAFDASGVPTITVQATTLPGNVVTTSECANDDPFGGKWTCNWLPGETAGVTQVVLRAKATDGAGNVNPAWSDPVTLTVDTTPPVLSLDATLESILASGAINDNLARTLTISATVTDNFHAARVELCAEDGECNVFGVTPGDAPVGRWLYPFRSLPSGDNVTQTLTLLGVDGAGNRSSPVTRTYVIDSAPPTLVITQALNQVGTLKLPGTLPVVLAGTVSDGGGVSAVYVRMVTPSGQASWTTASFDGSNWSFAPTVSEVGAYIITVEARDAAGNVAAFGPHNVIVTSQVIYLPVISRNALSVTGHAVYLPLISRNAP